MCYNKFIKKLDIYKNSKEYFEYLHEHVRCFYQLKHNKAKSYEDAFSYTRFDHPALSIGFADTEINKRWLVLTVREKLASIDFDKLKNDSAFAKLKSSITANNPELEYTPTINFIKQICNSIAHGDIQSYFDFIGWREYLKQHYNVSTLRALQNLTITPHSVPEDYEKAGEMFASTIINFPSKYLHLKNSSVKREHEEVFPIYLSPSDTNILANLISKYYQKRVFVAERDEDLVFIAKDNESQENLGNLLTDELQEQTFLHVSKDIIEYFASEFKDYPKELEGYLKYTQSIALSKASISNLVLSGKTRALVATADSLKFERRNKLTVDKLGENALINGKARMTHMLFISEAYYASRIDNLYQENLVTEAVSLLSAIEANDLYPQLITSSQTLAEASAVHYDKEEKDLTPKDKTLTAKMIRNSFTHARYLYDPIEEELHLYDQVSREDKELEYKLTIPLETLEELNADCFDAVHEYFVSKINDSQENQ